MVHVINMVMKSNVKCLHTFSDCFILFHSHKILIIQQGETTLFQNFDDTTRYNSAANSCKITGYSCQFASKTEIFAIFEAS